MSPPSKVGGSFPLSIQGVNELPRAGTPDKRVPVIDRKKVDPQVLKAAEGMEAMFLDYMMQVMRKSVPDNEMSLDSPATKIYQSMLDSEVSQIAAKTGGVGLAEQIIAYLEAARYNNHGKLGQTHGSTGGTNEGQ